MSQRFWQNLEAIAVIIALIIATFVVFNLLYHYGPQSFALDMLASEIDLGYGVPRIPHMDCET